MSAFGGNADIRLNAIAWLGIETHRIRQGKISVEHACASDGGISATEGCRQESQSGRLAQRWRVSCSRGSFGADKLWPARLLNRPRPEDRDRVPRAHGFPPARIRRYFLQVQLPRALGAEQFRRDVRPSGFANFTKARPQLVQQPIPPAPIQHRQRRRLRRKRRVLIAFRPGGATRCPSTGRCRTANEASPWHRAAPFRPVRPDEK